MNPSSIAVVSVTYGDRSALVERMVDGARAEGVARIVLVDNASVHPERLSAITGVRVLRNATNEGSAGGFARGIEAALDDPAIAAVWLLDDDNVPRPGALARLLDAAAGCPGGAYACVREERRYLWEVAHGVDPRRAYPPRSSFLGFRVRDLFSKLRRHLVPAAGEALGDRLEDPIEIPFAPYGGLLIPRETVSRVGLPDREFFLYADDNEFTARISASGAPIWLVPTAEVDDIDESWNATGAAKNSLARLLDMDDPRRLHYAVRNQAVFEQKYWVDDPRSYAWNRRVYLGMLSLAARTPLRRRNYEVVREAVADAARILEGQ